MVQVAVRGTTLETQQFSDLTIVPLQALIESFGDLSKAADFGKLNREAWISLKMIYGELPGEWFNENLSRLTLHAAELMAMYQAVSQALEDDPNWSGFEGESEKQVELDRIQMQLNELEAQRAKLASKVPSGTGFK